VLVRGITDSNVVLRLFSSFLFSADLRTKDKGRRECNGEKSNGGHGFGWEIVGEVAKLKAKTLDTLPFCTLRRKVGCILYFYMRGSLLLLCRR